MQTFKYRIHALVLAVALVAWLGGKSAWAADLGAARIKVQSLCQVCHGMDGVAILTEAANLSGQQKTYIIAQLRAYRAGSRHDPQMSIISKTLTDADIENLAEWYSTIKVTVEAPR